MQTYMRIKYELPGSWKYLIAGGFEEVVRPQQSRCEHVGAAHRQRADALDLAESQGAVVFMCPKCSLWVVCEAKDEDEAERAGAEYRREICEKYPALAKSRGWI